jgi:hypothetical protein
MIGAAPTVVAATATVIGTAAAVVIATTAMVAAAAAVVAAAATMIGTAAAMIRQSERRQREPSSHTEQRGHCESERVSFHGAIHTRRILKAQMDSTVHFEFFVHGNNLEQAALS